MPSFRENRLMLLEAFSNNLINDDEFLLLYDLNKSNNLEIPYWNYEFHLDSMEDDECLSEFRFLKNDIYVLFDALEIAEEIKCENGFKVDGIEGLCIFLKRHAYPCRYVDMIPRFGRAIPQLCMINNAVMNRIYTRWGFLLTSFNQDWLSSQKLLQYAQKVYNKGAPLDNCWGFVDGTVRPVCRPGVNQRVLYNGHKKVHAIKFQSVVTPNGMIANLFGPLEGRRHDSALLARSGLLQDLQQHSIAPNGDLLCIYGDPAYPLRQQLQRSFGGAHLTPDQRQYNQAMSSVRVSVEWVFGDIVNYFKFLDFKKNLKIQLSAVGKMYIVCSLLQNARSCFYGSMTSNFFDCEPPLLSNYFQ